MDAIIQNGEINFETDMIAEEVISANERMQTADATNDVECDELSETVLTKEAVRHKLDGGMVCGNVWKFFQKLDGVMAACTLCGEKRSYRSTSGNLRKHLRNKHGADKVKNGVLVVVRNRFRKKTSSVWDFFKSLEDNAHAVCNMCNKTFSYSSSVSNLKKHLKSKHSHSKQIKHQDGADLSSIEHSIIEVEEMEPQHPKHNMQIQKSFKYFSKPTTLPLTKTEKEVQELNVKKLKLELDILEREAYSKSLQILKLEKELGLPSSVYTTNLQHADAAVNATQTYYVVESQPQAVSDHIQEFGNQGQPPENMQQQVHQEVGRMIQL